MTKVLGEMNTIATYDKTKVGAPDEYHRDSDLAYHYGRGFTLLRVSNLFVVGVDDIILASVAPRRPIRALARGSPF
jgi:hypothetical protein